jgi:hypothetical protein
MRLPGLILALPVLALAGNAGAATPPPAWGATTATVTSAPATASTTGAGANLGCATAATVDPQTGMQTGKVQFVLTNTGAPLAGGVEIKVTGTNLPGGIVTKTTTTFPSPGYEHIDLAASTGTANGATCTAAVTSGYAGTAVASGNDTSSTADLEAAVATLQAQVATLQSQVAALQKK